MATLGFVRAAPAKAAFPKKDPASALTTFDSGNLITFAEACMPMLVLGTTGSGKTSCVMLPALDRLLAAGFAGLVIDIKGNLGDALRLLAHEHKREVVEFGSGPLATPVNLLEGMKPDEVYALFYSLVMQSFDGASGNKDFHVRGVRMACDCVMLCWYMAKADARFTPSISRVAEMFSDFELAAKMFAHFREHIHNSSDREEACFIRAVTSDEFHPLMFDAKKITRSSTYMEQVTYVTRAVLAALKNFLEAPGIAEGFASLGTGAVNMGDLVYGQGKIVLLRFGVGTGEIGANLARYCLEEYYRAVFAKGLTMPERQYTFVVADEFQDFVDLSPSNRHNDNAFTAKAREFHNIFIAGAQSLAALGNRGASSRAVEAFVANCNNRIMFYSDDPFTQQMASRYLPEKPLNALESGQTLVVQFDMTDRKHKYGIETLQRAHDKLRADLDRRAAALRPGETQKKEIIADVVQNLQDVLDEQPAQHGKASDKVEQESPSPFRNRWLGGEGKGEKSMPEEHTPSKVEVKVPEGATAPPELVVRYPEFFPDALEAKEFDQLLVPPGWLPAVDKALMVMRENGLCISISSFMAGAGILVATEEGARFSRAIRGYEEGHLGMALLNSLLCVTRNICALCGRSAKSVSSGLPLCGTCLRKFKLPDGDDQSGEKDNEVVCELPQ